MYVNHKIHRSTLWSTLLSISLVLLIALSFGGAVLAQSDPTPTPDPDDDGIYTELDGPRPEIIEGDATWTIHERIYTPDYPDGFTFEIAAESDADEIRNARVVWTHAPGTQTQRSVGSEFDPDTGRWVAHWEPGGNRVPPWVLVRYRWELTDEQDNRYLTAEIDELYEDVRNADRWRHIESDEVVAHWIAVDDEFGEQAIEAMAARREFYRLAWGGLLTYRPRVILFGWDELEMFEEFLNRPALNPGGTSITAGQTNGDWGGTVQIVLTRHQPLDVAYGTVLHEVGHLYQEHFSRVNPDWFIEGNAQFFMLAQDGDYRAYALERLQSDDPLSFAAGFSTDGERWRDGYWMGTTVWQYLVETYGLDVHRQIWELISQNVPRFEAIEQATGVSIEQFEMDWRRWIGVDTPPPTLIPTAVFDVFTLPTPTFAPPPG